MASVSDLVVATAEVRDGRLRLHNRRAFDEQVAQQLRDGWEVEVTVHRLQATRSLDANRYYWAVVIQLLSEHLGYTPDEMHDVLKMKFLPKRLALCDGNGVVLDEYVVGGSTRDLSVEEFAAYIDEIQQWAREVLDLIIPDADETIPASHRRADSASRVVWYRAKRRVASQ